MLHKEKILEFMRKRLEALKDVTDRDINGGLHSDLEVMREVKWWKEAIERGEFDM